MKPATKTQLAKTIQTTVHKLFAADVVIELSRPEEKFGDYATNVALQLAKQLGRSPRDIAEQLAAELRSLLTDSVAEVMIAGPGFLNLTLTSAALAEAAQVQPADSLKGKTCLVEYSDPNPFKPLHAGHLYTTLVGDTIARLAEHAGANVVRINYGGDVGLHVAKSLWAIVHVLGGEVPDNLADIPVAERPAWLGARYVEGNTAYEDDEAAMSAIVEINKRVYQLHDAADHDSPLSQIYWTTRQWSYDYFAVLYDQLQVKPFDRYIPESEVTPLGLSTVREQLARGVYKVSDGAVVFDGEAINPNLHTRVFINSAGLPTYETKDVGLLLTKWRDYHFDNSIVITANEQAQYMAVMLASVAQFEPEPVERTHHLTHGIVKMQGGIKISSRTGNGVTALEILDAARAAAAGTDNNASEDTILAAVKYAFARNRIGGDIIYDPKESIALEGNSGPYLQYAHARARSILVKAAASVVETTDAADQSAQTKYGAGLQPDERRLLRRISEYPEVIDRAVAELMPHYICTYLYELAQAFNRFYEHNRVIGDARQIVRLQLVADYADRLKAGLELLGIVAPERM
jgi:arginyl-tRNA synthetase